MLNPFLPEVQFKSSVKKFRERGEQKMYPVFNAIIELWKSLNSKDTSEGFLKMIILFLESSKLFSESNATSVGTQSISNRIVTTFAFDL